MPKDIFGFAEFQEKATCDFGYNTTLTRNKDDAVIDKAVGFVDAENKNDHIHWYVLHYTPFIRQQSILSNQILSETHTEHRYADPSIFMKEVNDQNLWNFELGRQESMNVHTWSIIEFQQRDRQDSQNLTNDTFCRLPVVSAQCIIGTEKSPDAGILLKYDVDDYSQGYAEIKEVFRASTNIISLHHIYQKMTSDPPMLGLMMLVMIYTFSI